MAGELASFPNAAGAFFDGSASDPRLGNGSRTPGPLAVRCENLKPMAGSDVQFMAHVSQKHEPSG